MFDETRSRPSGSGSGKREGKYYRIVSKCNSTLLLASHGGSSSVVLTHIFNLPFSFVCRSIRPSFTAITEVVFDGELGSLTSPEFHLVNDAKHIASVTAEE